MSISGIYFIPTKHHQSDWPSLKSPIARMAVATEVDRTADDWYPNTD